MDIIYKFSSTCNILRETEGATLVLESLEAENIFLEMEAFDSQVWEYEGKNIRRRPCFLLGLVILEFRGSCQVVVQDDDMPFL